MAWIIIDIENIIILSSIKVFISRIVFRLTHSCISLIVFSDYFAYFFPFSTLPHISLWDINISKHSYFSLFFTLDTTHLLCCHQFLDFLGTHPWFFGCWFQSLFVEILDLDMLSSSRRILGKYSEKSIRTSCVNIPIFIQGYWPDRGWKLNCLNGFFIMPNFQTLIITTWAIMA